MLIKRADLFVIMLVDYVIPKGCFVVPFLSAVHLDENLYKEAVTFNPWRWMDPENEVRTTKNFIKKLVLFHPFVFPAVKFNLFHV